MLTSAEYIELKKNTKLEEMNWDPDDPNTQKIYDYNKELVERYPFLWPRKWNGEKLDLDIWGYDGSELDWMPDGWRIAFGDEMMEELAEELKKYDWLDKYFPIQIKEKYGAMRWYDNGWPDGSRIPEIIQKYEHLSYSTCINCGKPARWISRGWIMPFCEDCAKDRLDWKVNRHLCKEDITVADIYDKLEEPDENT